MKPFRDWPLRAKILVPVILGLLFLSLAFLGISYYTFRQYTIDDCIDYARGLNSLVAREIDPDHIDDYIEQGHSYPGYDAIEETLYALRNGYPDAKYLYVYQIQEDGCHVVFDLDTEDVLTEDVPAQQPGEIVPFDPSFEPYREELLSGREVPPIISDDSFGYLLTVYTPIKDAEGITRCYTAVDISMEDISAYIMVVIRNLFMMSLLILLAFFLLSVFLTDRGIIRPMKRMEKKAYQDTMTGLLNRTALSENLQSLNQEIQEETADFSILMIDINYLKKINDTYGHDKGNEYLINSTKLITEVFGSDQVFRSGGDEIVLIRKGADQDPLPGKIKAFQEAMETLKKDESLSPWQKVSAALGCAEYKKREDTGAESVLKRADALMYENKLAMKAARKD